MFPDGNGEVPTSSGGDHSPRMGTTDSARGETQGKDIQRGLQGPELCFQLRNRKGVSQWVRIFQMYGRARVQPTTKIPKAVCSGNSGDGGHAQPDGRGTPSDTGDSQDESTPVQKDPIESNQWIEVEGVKPSKTRSRQEANHQSFRERSSHKPDANRTECRENPATPGPDCTSPARAGKRDPRSLRSRGPIDTELEPTVGYINSDVALPTLSADQEKMIHQELALKIAEVEDGLSHCPHDMPVCRNHVPVVTRSNLIHDQGRPLTS